MDNYHMQQAGPYLGYAGTNDQRSQIASMHESRVSPPQMTPAQQFHANGISQPSQIGRFVSPPSSTTSSAATLPTFISGSGEMSAYDSHANANVSELAGRRTSVVSSHVSPRSPSLSFSSSSSSLSIRTSSPPTPPTVQIPYTQIKGQQQLYQKDVVSAHYLGSSSLTATSLGSPPSYPPFMPSSPSSHPQSTIRLQQSLPSLNSSFSTFPSPSQQISPVQFQATAAVAPQAHFPPIPSALTSLTHQAAPGTFNPASLGPFHHGINTQSNYMPNIQANLSSASQVNQTLLQLPTNGATTVPTVMPAPATAVPQLMPLRPPVFEPLMAGLPVPGAPYALAGAGSTSQPLLLLQQHPTNHRKAQKPRKALQALGKIGKAAGTVALYVAGGALSATTGVSSRIVTEGGTAIANLVAALRRKAANDGGGGVGGISEADIQAVVKGRPDANYQAVVRYLLIQQQIQQQQIQQQQFAQYQQSIATQHVQSQSIAQPEPAPGVDYEALINELQSLVVMQQAVVLADSGPVSSPPQSSAVQQPMYDTGTGSVDQDASLRTDW